MRLAFLASHNGSAARAIADACRGGDMNASPVLLLSNNPQSNALEWAKRSGLVALCLNTGNQGGEAPLDRAMARVLTDHAIDLVLCSGYMRLIGPQTIAAMRGRILNIHPSLLPHHGGTGMYGRRVHESVAASGDAQTGITIHLVNGQYDRGRIIAQKALPLSPGDTAEAIEAKVKAAEIPFYIETLRRILNGAIDL